MPGPTGSCPRSWPRGRWRSSPAVDGCVTVTSTASGPAPPTTTGSSSTGWRRRSGAPARCPPRPSGPASPSSAAPTGRWGALSAYRAIAEDEVDLVVHLGDYLYEEPKGPFAVEPGGTCVTLDDYRRRHAHTRLDADLQALHLRHPMMFVWDDHDTADNAWRARGQGPRRGRARGRGRSAWPPPPGPGRSGCRAAWPTPRIRSTCTAASGSATCRAGGARHPHPGPGPPVRRRGRQAARTIPTAGSSPKPRWRGPRSACADRSATWAVVTSQVPVARLAAPGAGRARWSTPPCRAGTGSSTARPCAPTSGTATRCSGPRLVDRPRRRARGAPSSCPVTCTPTGRP